ncbi:hypothetical protein R3I94_013290 [Phoxinus phoxinus]
MQEQSN